MKCEYCNQHNHDHKLVCDYCGAPLPVKYTADKKIIFKYIPPCCTSCGRQLSETEAFCKECQTISPAVAQTFEDNPEKSCDDFVRTVHKYHGEYYTDCPHCGNTYKDKSALFSLSIGSPIVICKNCHMAYLRPENEEWSVLPTFQKLLALLLRNDRWMILFLFMVLAYFVIGLIPELGLAFVFWGIPLAAVVLTAAHLLSDQEKVQLSKSRLEQNPEYPQILFHMGYWKIIPKEQYFLAIKDILVNWKNELKEIIKEAFTFD